MEERAGVVGARLDDGEGFESLVPDERRLPDREAVLDRRLLMEPEREIGVEGEEGVIEEALLPERAFVGDSMPLTPLKRDRVGESMLPFAELSAELSSG